MDQVPQDARTPLGTPIDEASASFRAQDPHGWLLKYWLNLYSIGISRLEDAWLLAARIHREHITKMAPGMFKDQFQAEWGQFMVENSAEYYRTWTSKANIDLEEYMAYVVDLDRMLEQKELKTREYILWMFEEVYSLLRAGDIAGARLLYDSASVLNVRMKEEEKLEAETRDIVASAEARENELIGMISQAFATSLTL